MKPQDAVIRLLNAGWTQVRLADVVGTSQSTIHRIKSGTMHRSVPFELAMALITLAEGLSDNVRVKQVQSEQRAP